MRKRIFGTSLFIVLAVAGCASSQLHQSLLLQENRRLEDALYVAHTQATDLKRENDLLRKRQANGVLELPGHSYLESLEDELDINQPFEMPKVILPSEPGTTEVPEALRGSQAIPIWKPRR